MADIMIRKRKRMRSKEVKALAKELEETMGVPVFSEEDGVDMAESSDFDLIFVKSDILGTGRTGGPSPSTWVRSPTSPTAPTLWAPASPLPTPRSPRATWSG